MSTSALYRQKSFPPPLRAEARAGARGTPFTGASLVELLRFRSVAQPADVAYTFLKDGDRESERVTYRALDLRSRAIAARLQARTHPGDRALLLYPPGLDFIAAFFGCLYARVVAVPAHLPRFTRSDRALARLRSIAADAHPAAVVTSGDVMERWSRVEGDVTGRLGDCEWIASDAIASDEADQWSDPGVASDSLAFLQYTSGSTTAPRGVMISHGNLLHNLAYAFHLGESDASSVSVSWLPAVHDMGLIEGVLQPAFSGCPAYLMSPTSFLQRPVRWLKAIARYRATRSGGPNFAYDLCARRIGPEERAGLDLRTWRAAYNGAEPVRHDTMRNFASAFGPYGFTASAFRPCYGLAEATLLVAGGRWSDEHLLPHGRPHGRVSCGTPAFGTRVEIADPHTGQPCETDAVGEIWVAGPGVAQGYWRRPDESASTFGAYSSRGEGPFLRTGDLGYVRDDELVVTGRLKDVLIVRGMKHYPQDLERTAEGQHPAIRAGCSVAFATDVGPIGDRIAVVAEADVRLFDPARGADAAIAAIRRSVAELHGVQLEAVLLVGPGAIPKTTSGKQQRFACRQAFLADDLPVLAAWRDSAREEPCP